jgi:hypothetical protein
MTRLWWISAVILVLAWLIVGILVDPTPPARGVFP